jgi:predicted transposase YbfD/YdcC
MCLDDLAAAGADQRDALYDIQGLAEPVRVPRGTSAGTEPDGVRPHPGRFFAPVDDVTPDVTGEPLRRSLEARRLLEDFHQLHAQVRALPCRQVPAGSVTRERGHGRAETRTLKAAHVSGLDFPHTRQAIKITRWRQDTPAGRASRQAVYAVTSLTSAQAAAGDLARLVREQWSIEAHHHVRDVTFGEDASASRTGSGPVNLATIRAAVIAALKDAGYLHIPGGRRDHTTPAETLRLHGLD